MPLQPAICAAISNRQVVRFRYQGGVRLVEPYTHGRSTAGHEVLRGFQISGASHSGQPSGWKLFDMAKIADVEVTRATFPHTRSGYRSKDSALRFIHCQVPSPASASLGLPPHR